MANESKSKKKNVIIGVIIAIIIIVLIALVAIFAINKNGGISDDYFKTDDTKYVITRDGDLVYVENIDDTPLKTHTVYTHADGKVTSYKNYFEYKDTEAAKTAYERLKDTKDEDYESIELKGKYIVFTMKPEVYEFLTPEEIQEQIDFLQSVEEIGNEELEGTEAEVTEEPTEEVVEETEVVEE